MSSPDRLRGTMIQWNRRLEQGITAGLIGFATIAGLFIVIDVVAGRPPFHTAALLGSALYGIEDPSLLSISTRMVVAYSALHLAVFIVFGLLAVILAEVADRGRQLWFVALFFFIFISFHLFAAAQGIAAPMRASLPDALVWGAGMAASLTMAWYLIRSHPRMRAKQSW